MIEVGDYVRTKTGKIRKIVEKLAQYYLIEKVTFDEIVNCNNTAYEDGDIVNHSKNIIDLIEVGDYVNGEKVFATENRINDNGEKIILTENYDEWTDNGVTSNKDIKTILTKELFEANCYKVKEE